MKWPIEKGTVEIVDVARKKAVGYGFVEEGAPEVQRWVLNEDYCAPPVSTILLQQPADPSRRYTRLDAWTNAVRNEGLFRPQARYVKVNCAAYSSINSRPAPSFFPPEPPITKQIEEGVAKILKGEQLVGYVYASRIEGSPRHSFEHWILLDGFAAPSDASIWIGPPQPSEAAPTLSLFLERISMSWSAGSTYVIASCNEFKGALPVEL